MNRRAVLGALAGGSALVAGCLGRRGSVDGPEGNAAVTDGGTELAVDRVETFSHPVRLNDLGRSPAGDVPRAAELSEREREVVRAAVDGGYETSALPDWFVQFVATTPHVSVDGSYYRLRADLPETRVTAEPVAEADVEGSVASTEAYRSAVTHDGVVTTGLLREARRDGVTLTYVWPSLREFLAEYDAVRFRGEVVAVSTTERDPGPPYAVTAERMSLAELAGDPVWNVADADPAVRSVVRSAGATEGLYPLDDPPEGLIEGLDAHRYVFLDGRFYTTYVEKRGELPVSLSASFVDPVPDGDAVLRLELHNETAGVLRVTSGAPAPFGVLQYHPAGRPDDRRLLWTDAYAESEHVMTDGHEVTGWHSVAVATQVGPGGSAAREFVVEETAFPDDEYVVPGEVRVSPPDEDGTFPYRVRFGAD